MKFAKLSLAAMVIAALAPCSFAADTLADAFKNGKLTGEIKAFYFDRDTGDATTSIGAGDANIFSTGVMLNYVTDSLYGLKAGITVQTSSAPFADEDAKQVFAKDMYGSGAVLSEAYLEYTLSKTTFKVGRQFISSPLVASSGSRIIKDSFEGATVINTALPDTTIGFGYVDKWQARTNQGWSPKSTGMADFKQVGDGAYTLFVINKSIPGLMLSGAWAGIQEYNVGEDLDLYRFEAKYDGKATNFTYNLGAQYFATEYSGTTADATGFALKAGVGVSAIDAYVAYSKIEDGTGKVKYGLGYGADTLYTQSPIISDNYGGGTEAYAVDIAYKFSADAKIGIDYTATDNGTGTELSYSAVYGSYAFGGSLKGLSILVQYEKEGKDGNDEELRVKTSYKF